MVNVTFDKRNAVFADADSYSVTKEGMLQINRGAEVIATVACHTWLYVEIGTDSKTLVKTTKKTK